MNVRIAAMVIVFAASSMTAHGAVAVWEGSGGNLWTDADSWVAGVTPTAGVDTISIVGAADAPFTVNLGGNAFTDVIGDALTIEHATITNGGFHMDAQGSIVASHAVFNAGGHVGSQIRSVTFNDVTYSNNTGWNIKYNSTFAINGGAITNHGQVTVGGDGGSGSLTISGGTGTHLLSLVRMNIDAATPASAAANLSISHASVRATSASGSLLGNSSGLGAAVSVTLDHAFFRADAGLTFGSITTLASTDSTLEVSGTSTTQGVFNFMTSDASFDGEGLTVNVRPENVRVQYEVGGADLGATFAGFHDNFSIDRLNGAHPLVPSWTNAGVTLVDSVNNSGGVSNEALYVDHLNLDEDFTIDLAGRNLYYKKLTTNGHPLTVLGGTLTQVTGAALMPTAPYQHMPDAGTVNRHGGVLTVGSDFGTVFVGQFDAGATVRLLLDLTGDPADIATLAGQIGADTFIPPELIVGDLQGHSWDLLLTYTGAADGGPLFFDWNFSHLDVTLEHIAAVPEPASVAVFVVALVALRNGRSTARGRRT